jgi:hypothetical protein
MSDRLTEHSVDLNYLLKRHQASLGMMQRGTCARLRAAHKAFADGYAAKVALAMLDAQRHQGCIS